MGNAKDAAPVTTGNRVNWLRALMPWMVITTLSKTAAGMLRDFLASLGTPILSMLELAAATPAGATTALLAATATVNGTQTVTVFVAGGLTELATRPRNMTVTTGGTAAHGPSQVVWTGTDIDGNALTETLALSQAAGTDVGVKAFASLASAVFTGGTNTDATVAIGTGNKFGLPASIKTRATRLAVIQEVSNGAVVTNGTFVSPATSPPHGTYSPNTTPDGTKPYAVTYEQIVP